MQMIEVTLDEDTSIYIESMDSKSCIDTRKNVAVEKRLIQKTRDEFEKSLKTISDFSAEIVNAVKHSENAPNEMEISFSVKFAAEIGLVITSVGSEANLSVKLKWKKGT